MVRLSGRDGWSWGETGGPVLSLVTEHLAGRGVAFEVVPTGALSPHSRKPGRWCGRRGGPQDGRAVDRDLCDRARFTGYTIDGGFAEETLADARYCFAVPEG
jgi:propanol-preferring alcohol dehydrogenase